jgi:hypothetical protein
MRPAELLSFAPSVVHVEIAGRFKPVLVAEIANCGATQLQKLGGTDGLAHR